MVINRKQNKQTKKRLRIAFLRSYVMIIIIALDKFEIYYYIVTVDRFIKLVDYIY
jgi:hypothetical protein